jgi:hypothetical protein
MADGGLMLPAFVSEGGKWGMRKEANAILCALLTGLTGCSSSQFVKLDATGKADPSANPEAYQRDLADCQVTATRVRSEAGAIFGYSSAKSALDNCMRSKGYLKG